MANKIRRLAVGREIKDRIIFSIDSVKPVFSTMESGSRIEYFVSEILETNDEYKIFVRKGRLATDEIQHWRNEMKSDITHPEFFLD